MRVDQRFDRQEIAFLQDPFVEPTMATFADVVEAADQLSVDEQESLVEILTHRIAELRRRQLVRDVAQARSEHQAGRSVKATVSEIMDEIRHAP